MSWFDEIKKRGLINSITNEEKISSFLSSNKSVYVGFDPSASSLHLGNYVMILLARRLHNAGIKVYPVVGGATGMIGDPSGKSDERVLLNQETVLANKEAIKAQLIRYTRCTTIIDNLDFYKNMLFLDFLRDVGKFVSINYLLEKEIIKNRLSTTGISYTEFSYNLIQSYDFVSLYRNYNVALQLGGSDQWGNITAGIEMIRKMIGDDNCACGITINLLTNKDGKKFGKSEKGAIYLDPEKTSPYEMYQYLINQDDSDVIRLLNFLTLISSKEIDEIQKQQELNPASRIAQYTLANWIVNDVHGPEVLLKVQDISQKLFNGDIKNLDPKFLKQALNDIPSLSVSDNKYSLVDIMVETKICPSKTTARQLINSNSIMINGDKVNDPEFIVQKSDAFDNEFTIIRKGKKNYFLVFWK